MSYKEQGITEDVLLKEKNQTNVVRGIITILFVRLRGTAQEYLFRSYQSFRS